MTYAVWQLHVKSQTRNESDWVNKRYESHWVDFSMAKWMCIRWIFVIWMCVSVELLLPRGAEVIVIRFPHPICESCWIQHTMYWTRKRDLLQIIFTPVTMANRGGSDGMGFGFDFKAFNNSVIRIMWYSFVYFSWGVTGLHERNENKFVHSIHLLAYWRSTNPN